MGRTRNREKDRQYQKAYRATHKEEHKAYLKARKHIDAERRQRIKFEVLEHYSIIGHPNCLFCGIDDLDVLQIDHIDNNGAEQKRNLKKRGGCQFYCWLQRNDYPDGYQVLCANCNVKKEIQHRRNRAGL